MYETINYNFPSHHTWMCCLICLLTDCKLLSLESYGLGGAYEQLTDVTLQHDDGLPRELCVECATLLVKFYKFKDKCHTAYKLLYLISINEGSPTKSSILSIDRTTYKLITNIGFSSFTGHIDIPPDQLSQERHQISHPSALNADTEVIDSGSDYDKQDFHSVTTDNGKPMQSSEQNFQEKGNISPDWFSPESRQISHLTALNADTEEFDSCSDDDKPLSAFDSVTLYSGKFKLKGEQNFQARKANNPIINNKDLKKNEIVNNDIKTDKFTETNVAQTSTDSDDGFDSYLEDILCNTDNQKDKSENINKPETYKLTNKHLKLLKRKRLKERNISFNKSAIAVHNKEVKRKTVELLNECFNIKVLVDIEEQRASFEKKMQDINYLNYEFKCKLCFKGYKVERFLMKHVKNYHSEEQGRYICHLCKMRKKYERHMIRHIKQMHLYEYQCKECTSSFTNENAAKTHAMKHMKYTCKHCGKQISRMSAYYDHIRYVHPSNDVCVFCGYCFVRGHGLTTHKRKAHLDILDSVISGPTCASCHIQFASEKALETHVAIKHPAPHSRAILNNYRHPNSVVKKYYYNQSAKTNKKQTSAETNKKRKRKPTHCDVCGEKITSTLQYRAHYKSEHPEKEWSLVATKVYGTCFICDQCGKAFAHKVSLEEHMFDHNAADGSHPCEHCGRVFRSLLKLKIHRKVHEMAECDLCGIRITKMNIRRHITGHTEERNWSCNVCEKKFKTKPDLSQHIKYVHHKVPWPKKKTSADTRSPVARSSHSRKRNKYNEDASGCDHQ